MKKSTLAKRIERGHFRGVALEVLKELAGIKNYYRIKTDGKIRPAGYTGRGRFISKFDHSDSIIDALNACKLKFVFGNDAPRGGVSGKYIIVKTKLTD